MMPLSDGINVDPNIAMQVMSNKLAQAAAREAQMEAAIQQLIMENQMLKGELEKHEAVSDEVTRDAAEE